LRGWLVLRSGDLGSELAGGGVVAVAVVGGVVDGLLHFLGL
jgi:hypothetical protein